jgi:hypothetical protein
MQRHFYEDSKRVPDMTTQLELNQASQRRRRSKVLWQHLCTREEDFVSMEYGTPCPYCGSHEPKHADPGVLPTLTK